MTNKYKNSYLATVVAKINFLNSIDSLQNSIPNSISDICTKYFPILEPKEMTKLGYSFSFGVDNIPKTEDTKFKEWNFYNKNRDNHLIITPEYMAFEYKAYDNWEDFIVPFLEISSKLFDNTENIKIQRLGLRFINSIELQGTNLFNWKPYLNKNLLSVFNFPIEQSRISRAFNELELNLDEYFVRFKYGMFNPDYPAAIKRKVFILDYDAYSTVTLNYSEISALLPVFHEKIKELFENSITEKLRAIMNE